MKTAIYSLRNKTLSSYTPTLTLEDEKVNLVLCFGAKSIFISEKVFEWLKEKFTSAEIVLCSTAGEICHSEVIDDSISVNAMQFEQTTMVTHSVVINHSFDSYEAGKKLLQKFDTESLFYVLILNDGSQMNRNEFTRGIKEVMDKQFIVAEGTIADGVNYQFIMAGIQNEYQVGSAAAIGFYGKNLQVRHHSKSDWETPGCNKQVSNSPGNTE